MGYYGYNYTPLTPSIDWEACQTMKDFRPAVLSLETIGQDDSCPVGFYYKETIDISYSAN